MSEPIFITDCFEPPEVKNAHWTWVEKHAPDHGGRFFEHSIITYVCNSADQIFLPPNNLTCSSRGVYVQPWDYQFFFNWTGRSDGSCKNGLTF